MVLMDLNNLCGLSKTFNKCQILTGRYFFSIEHPVYYFTCHSQKYLGPCKLFKAYLVGVIACLLLTVIIGINVKN